MTDNVNIEDVVYRNNTIEEFQKDSSEGDMMPMFEEVTVMKTEVKQECADFDMSRNNIVFVNVKEEYVSSPEDNIEKDNLEFTNSSELSLNDNLDVLNCNFKHLQENKYRCALCHSDFDEKIYLKNHYQQCPFAQQKLSKECKRYQCADCMFSTSFRSNLIKHTRIHAKDKPFKCTYKNCKCIPGLDEFCECDTCDYAAIEKATLQRHVLVKHSTESKKYKCSDCTYASHREADLKLHIRTHTNERPFKCTYKDCKCRPGKEKFCKCDSCGYAAKKKSALHKHMLIKHSAESKKYKCTDCNYSSHMKSALQLHIRIHTNERPFKCTYKNCKCTPRQEESCDCEICEYAAIQKSNLEKHILIMHKAESKKYRCKDCNYATYMETNLLVHIRTHINERPYKCTYKYCNCTPEQEDFCMCDTCGYSATQKSTLQKHVLVKHSAELKKYKCSDCEYATHRKVDLTRHIRTHSNDKPFKCMYKNCKCTPEQEDTCQCDMCEYSATEKGPLERHVLVKHSAESKRYKCSDCTYATHVKGDLTRHIRTHTNERPFKCIYKNCKCTPGQEEFCECDMCTYAAKSRSNLKKHTLKMHSVKPKEYKCEFDID